MLNVVFSVYGANMETPDLMIWSADFNMLVVTRERYCSVQKLYIKLLNKSLFVPCGLMQHDDLIFSFHHKRFLKVEEVYRCTWCVPNAGIWALILFRLANQRVSKGQSTFSLNCRSVGLEVLFTLIH